MLLVPGSGHVVALQSSYATFRQKTFLNGHVSALLRKPCFLWVPGLQLKHRGSALQDLQGCLSDLRAGECFLSTSLNYTSSVQSWLGLFLGLGLTPQCLSLWGRASPSQFSLLKMLMRALAPLHLPGNTVQTRLLPRNLQRGQIWTCFIKAKRQS